MERILDTYEACSFVKKGLQEISKLKSRSNTILVNVNDYIINNYEGKKIETELGKNYLTIYSEKKKNSALNEIKNKIEDIILAEAYSVDLDMLFNIYKNDNKIVIKYKRNMEQ